MKCVQSDPSVLSYSATARCGNVREHMDSKENVSPFEVHPKHDGS